MGLTTEVMGEFYNNDQVGPFTVAGWVHPSSVAALEETKGGRPDSCFLTENIRILLKPLKKETGWVFLNAKTGRP